MSEFAFQFLLTLDATLRVSTPLILCAMAGIFSERSGIIDISLEGKMLMGAFVAATVASLTGSVWLGAICAIASCVILALIHGFACITHRGNHVVSGVAINILTAGLTVTLAISWFHQGGQTPPLPDGARFTAIVWPGAKESSVLWHRMGVLDTNRMPPLGSNLVDAAGAAVVGEWIDDGAN